MFIHILNLTYQHLNVAVGSEFAVLACGPEILPIPPCGTETELWKMWKDIQASSPFGQHI